VWAVLGRQGRTRLHWGPRVIDGARDTDCAAAALAGLSLGRIGSVGLGGQGRGSKDAVS